MDVASEIYGSHHGHSNVDRCPRQPSDDNMLPFRHRWSKGSGSSYQWINGDMESTVTCPPSIDPTRRSDTHRSLARSIRGRIILLYTLRMNRVSRVEIQLSYTIYD